MRDIDENSVFRFVVFGFAIIGVVTTLVVAIPLIAYGVMSLRGPDFGGVKSLNELGDAFGISNAVFSGLAFVGLVITLALQYRSLEQQRRDVRTNQEHLEQSIREMAQTSESTSRMAKAQAVANQLNTFELGMKLKESLTQSWAVKRNGSDWEYEHFNLIKQLRSLFRITGAIPEESTLELLHETSQLLFLLSNLQLPPSELLNKTNDVFERITNRHWLNCEPLEAPLHPSSIKSAIHDVLVKVFMEIEYRYDARYMFPSPQDHMMVTPRAPVEF